MAKLMSPISLSYGSEAVPDHNNNSAGPYQPYRPLPSYLAVGRYALPPSPKSSIQTNGSIVSSPYSSQPVYSVPSSLSSALVPSPTSIPGKEVGTSFLGDKFKCQQCPKTYKLESSLRQHLKTHSPNYKAPRQHSCANCHMSFRYPKDLQRHQHTHILNPDRSYKCIFNDCLYAQKGFVRRDHLLRHLRHQHDTGNSIDLASIDRQRSHARFRVALPESSDTIPQTQYPSQKPQFGVPLFNNGEGYVPFYGDDYRGPKRERVVPSRYRRDTSFSPPPEMSHIDAVKREERIRGLSLPPSHELSATNATPKYIETPEKQKTSSNKAAKSFYTSEPEPSGLGPATIEESVSNNRQFQPRADSNSTSDVSDMAEMSDTAESADRSVDSYASSPSGVNFRKRQLVDSLMGHFFSLFSICCRSPRITNLGNSDTGQDLQNIGQNCLDSESNTPFDGASRSSNKRKAEEEPDNDDTAEDGSAKRPPKKTKPVESSSAEVPTRFACPYFKRNPPKYQSMRSCTGPGFDSVHRLKEHLYRLHRLPLQCSRCSQTFKSDALLIQHQRQDPPCPVQHRQVTEGIDKEQEARLKSRKKDAEDMTDADKWRRVYRILFPYDDHSKLPSPYYEYGSVEEAGQANDAASAELSRYEVYLRQELPYSLRRELELRVDELLDSAEETLRSQLPTIFRDLQMRHFREYLQQRGLSLTNTPTQQGATQTAAGTDLPESPVAIDMFSTGNTDLLNDLASMDPTPWPLDSTAWPLGWFDGAIFEMPLGDAPLSESGYGSLNPGNTDFTKSQDHDTI